MKKFTILVLALLLLLGQTACSGDNQTETQTTDETVTQTEAISETPATYAEQVPVEDYNGWTLQIANDSWSAAYFSGFVVEELMGDAFLDAIYNRNIRIMEKYNIDIQETAEYSTNLLRNAVTAGTHEFGFGYIIFEDCMPLILEDVVKPISDLPVVDFSKPYWDQGSRESLTFDGKLYYGHCDISFDHYESMVMLFYNGQLLENNGIDHSPYQLYTEGKWTLENMYNMMTTVVQDLDGDGKMTPLADMYGLSCRDFECLPSLYSSSLRLLTLDNNTKTYAFHVTDESVMAVGDMLNKIMYDKNLSHLEWYGKAQEMFLNDTVLFYSTLLGDFKNLRDKEDDYGIIAYPALEEDTDIRVYIQNPFTIQVPADCENDMRLGTLLEALAADTYDNVLDVYINKAVIGKGTRDQESAELLRDYITKRDYDLFYAFGLRDHLKAYSNGLKNGSYASEYQKREQAMVSALESALAKLGYTK